MCVCYIVTKAAPKLHNLDKSRAMYKIITFF